MNMGEIPAPCDVTKGSKMSCCPHSVAQAEEVRRHHLQLLGTAPTGWRRFMQERTFLHNTRPFNSPGSNQAGG